MIDRDIEEGSPPGPGTAGRAQGGRSTLVHRMALRAGCHRLRRGPATGGGAAADVSRGAAGAGGGGAGAGRRGRAGWGGGVGGVGRFWSRVPGGRALGTTTPAPLAGSGRAGWIAPSR